MPARQVKALLRAIEARYEAQLDALDDDPRPTGHESTTHFDDLTMAQMQAMGIVVS